MHGKAAREPAFGTRDRSVKVRLHAAPSRVDELLVLPAAGADIPVLQLAVLLPDNVFEPARDPFELVFLQFPRNILFAHECLLTRGNTGCS